MRIALRPGDTLWAYSQWFNVPLSLILDSNPNLNPQNITSGQFIEIPGHVPVHYRIKSGDTLWSIAQTYRISLDSLFVLNPGIQPQGLIIGQFIQLPRRVVNPVVQIQGPYDYASMMADLDRLRSIYPFLRYRSIGSSVMGKTIPEVAVGRGLKRVHINGSFHANEWITTPILMRFLNEYLLAVTNNGAIRGLVMGYIYEATALSLVPMVNPDGVNLVVNGLPIEEDYRNMVLAINDGSTDFSGWKANIRGVDLNNQFPARWEIEAARKRQQPAPRDYPGPSPLTEPESQAMARLTRESNFDRVLAYHTQGEVIYWGFENLQPPEAEILANEFARVSGYLPIEFVDSYAGYKDWFIQEWRRPGFTIEAGRGTNPLPLSQFEEMYQENLGILLASLYS